MMKNELAVMEDFKLVSAYDGMDDEAKAELEEEMDDLDDAGGIDCRRIKVPVGKSKAFEVETDNPDDPEMVKELQAVILYTHKMNTRWEGEYNNENRLPACSSWDAKKGLNTKTGEIIDCDRCTFNQFNSDGTGKECKNMRRIYLMLSGKPYLYLLSVPPTSAKDVSKQLKRIMGANSTAYSHMVVTFKLVAATSKNGNDYNKVTIEKSGLLPESAFPITKAARESIKAQYRTVAIVSDDYNVAPAPDQAAPLADDLVDFVNIPDAINEEELPFN